MIKVTVDMRDLMRLQMRVKASSKQMDYAAARALNAAAYKAKKATAEAMARVFDKPTPWVLKSVRYIKATRSNLRAQIDFDFWGNKQGVTVSQVLQAEIFGGRRALKRHEVALKRAGVLPDGMAIVPGAAAQMDAYGNMSSGQINQILSWFSAFGEQGYSANMTAKGKARLARSNKRKGTQGFAYFVLKKRTGKLLPGIYKRFTFAHGSAVKPVMIFVRIPSYRRRLDFYGIAERAAVAEFRTVFPAYFQEAMRTAR